MKRRVEALEATEGPADEVQVILVSLTRREGCTGDDVQLAVVVGTPNRNGAQLNRGEGEPLAEFRARVEAERLRVHGDQRVNS